jgi:CRISPR-associated endonuclease/helicase Cas3
LVARELLSHFPHSVRSQLFPDGVELVAAAHDIGKINPHFQEKLRRLLPSYKPNTHPSLKLANPDFEGSTGKHGGVSQIALAGVDKFIPMIVGMHHGSSPGPLPYLPNDQLLGGPAWQKTRMELIERLKLYFKAEWPKISGNLQASAIAGLTTVSDWIGSGPAFENLSSIDQSNLQLTVRDAVERAGFVMPNLLHGLTFEAVFPSYSPRPLQKCLYEKVEQPGTYILEALMGSGKTEAALFAAYRMMEVGLAHGIYFALPTKITSEKIYERMQKFLKSILAPGENQKAYLAHGSAWMFDSDMGEDAQPGGEWFDSRKRKLLAPFAVGTIDQALMAVMNVKHGFVRTFGLAGKIVIIDEVHTYDAYTGTIMDFLVQGLRELGCTVILLSATLTEGRKRSFLSHGNTSMESQSPHHYPLVSISTDNKPADFSPPMECSQEKVHLIFEENEQLIYKSIRQRVLAGEHLLWIENTVQEAQDTFKSFAGWGATQNIQVGLIHSRFPASRRNELERLWVTAYGKEGLPLRKGIGKILIGTQVLEQSLDLDADLLVTRIAPTDMLLQRIGRLWRHNETNALRPSGARRQVFVLSPPIEKVMENPKFGFGPSGYVYAPYVLARTLLAFKGRESIIIPADMRELIEATYEEHIEKLHSMAEIKGEVIKQREVLRRFALQSLAMIGRAASDAISTRYSEIPSCDVLLLQVQSDLQKGVLTLLDHTTIHIPKGFLSLEKKKELARQCMLHMISVPTKLAPDPLPPQELSTLNQFLYISDNEDERLRIAILHPSNQIHGLTGREANREYALEYSSVLGYTAKKKEGI